MPASPVCGLSTRSTPRPYRVPPPPPARLPPPPQELLQRLAGEVPVACQARQSSPYLGARCAGVCLWGGVRTCSGAPCPLRSSRALVWCVRRHPPPVGTCARALPQPSARLATCAADPDLYLYDERFIGGTVRVHHPPHRCVRGRGRARAPPRACAPARRPPPLYPVEPPLPLTLAFPALPPSTPSSTLINPLPLTLSSPLSLPTPAPVPRAIKFMARCRPERLRFRLEPEQLLGGSGAAAAGGAGARPCRCTSAGQLACPRARPCRRHCGWWLIAASRVARQPA